MRQYLHSRKVSALKINDNHMSFLLFFVLCYLAVVCFLQLYVESTLKMEVAYYNEKISVWEPLLEPVLDGGKQRKWEIQLEVKVETSRVTIIPSVT